MHLRPIPKLIIVDGVSGSGKTTTCRWLAQQLQLRGYTAQAIYEADVPHPLHWWAYWDGIRHLPPDFERLSPADAMAASLDRWRQFVAAIHASDATVLVEGALYCLAVWFFLQADADRQQIASYVRQVDAIIRPVTPLLIYLRQDDLAAHTRRVWHSRGSAPTQELITNMERTPYLRRRDLAGFAGVVALWQDTQDLTDALVADQSVSRLVLEVSAGDWDTAYQRIVDAVLQHHRR